jgi:hypothetical protein
MAVVFRMAYGAYPALWPYRYFYFSLCRVLILLHRLIGAIFIGEVYFYGGFVIY